MLYKYANIIIAVSHKDIDREFTYIIPNNLQREVCIGKRVLIPFGAGNKVIEGVIVGFTNNIDFLESKAKYIYSVIDNIPIISEELLQLAFWMRDKYYTTLSKCIKNIIPTGLSVKNDFIIEITGKKVDNILTKAQYNIMNYIKSNEGKVLLSEIENDFSKSINQNLKILEENKYIVQKMISEVKNLSLMVNYVSINYDNENIDEFILNLKNDKQIKVINFLMDVKSSTISDVKVYLNINNSPIHTLIKQNILIITKKEVIRNSIFYEEQEKSVAPKFTEEQNNAMNCILKKGKIKSRSYCTELQVAAKQKYI